MSKNCACLSQNCTCNGLLNAPGLSTLSYRVSTYGKSRDRMFKLISKTAFESTDINDPAGGIVTGAPPLAGLTTRDTNDLTIAVIDSWAIVCDVLSFYQERIINEGYLRTATERRSVLELAREIGYELAPGISASGYLSYFVDDGPLSPRQVLVPKGSAVQSVPQKEEAPQTFEVEQDTYVRLSWNRILPQLSKRQTLAPELPFVLIQGAVPQVNRGDFVLIQPEGNNDLEVREVLENTFSATSNTTTLQLNPVKHPKHFNPSPITGAAFAPSYKYHNLFDQIEESVLQATLTEQSVDYQEVETVAAASLQALLTPDPGAIPSTKGHLPVGVYMFKYRTSNFGHNAPPYETLPSNLRVVARDSSGNPVDENGNRVSPRFDKDYSTCPITVKFEGAWPSGADFQLERSIPDLRVGDPLLIQKEADSPLAYQISWLSEDSVAEYMISGKSSGVKVDKYDKGPAKDLSVFLLRDTTILAGAIPLQLAASPVTTPTEVGDTTLTLNSMVTGLAVGSVLAISGESANHPGFTKTELASVKKVTHHLGLTTIVFEDPLINGYVRSSMQICANMVRANHGASVPDEILGSGDASSIHQTFTLKKNPLTYVSSSDPSGSTSSLEVRVNGVLWTQVPSLYQSGPTDKVYCVRIGDDGVVSIKFGDGKRGSRLPTATYNVVARYRQGIGVAGLVPATTLTLPKRKPLGIRSIVNPADTAGGVDPATRDEARVNAPTTVLTMQRIVSRKDLEDFAGAFAGVGKASATEINSKQFQLLLLTVGSSEGLPFDLTSDAFKSLQSGIKLAIEPSIRVEILTYSPVQFDVDADIQIDPAYVAKDVIAAVEAALIGDYSFKQRGFGQSVSLAEVTSTIQRIAGVTMVDINILKRTTGGAAIAPTLLEAKNADWTSAGSQMAELLTINPFGLKMTEVKP
ncbi:MAG: hypothetical protein P4L46_23950 [Fimbriimonas sp.]|nr:hypothetical protein [Fimbriimonas sp.]